MIKAVAESQKGQPLILLGLSEDNIKALKMNMPIDVETAELGLGDSRVIIFYGKTEDEMQKMFEEGGMSFGSVVDKREEQEVRGTIPADSLVVETGGFNIRLRFGDVSMVLDKDAAQEMVDMVQAKIDRMNEAPNAVVQ